MERRTFLRGLAATAAATAVAACGAAPAGPEAAATSASGAPAVALKGNPDPIKLGFIALTDCSALVMASELGLFKQYGLNVAVVKQASWAATRDNLLTNEIQGAHCLFGMPFSVYTGVGGSPGSDLRIAMMLNNNGQATTLSNEFAGKVRYGDMSGVKGAVDDLRKKKEVTFAMTFPGGTHDMWLRYWLAAAGVDQKAVKIIVVPPPNMVANMKVGNMDGFNVGEPWGGVAVKDGIGFTHIATQDIWRHHPEKALVVTPKFAAQRKEDLKLVMRAVLEAGKYIDDPKNKAEVAKIVGRASYVNAPADVVDDRMMGTYNLGGGLGRKTFTDDTMTFFRDGFVSFPRKAHAAWFMTQYVRFGYLKDVPDIKTITDKVFLRDVYLDVAKEMTIAVPDDDMAPFTMTLDGAKFDPADPAAYLEKYGGAN